MGDPDLLYQVFINLCLNAVQAMDGGRDERVLALALRREEGPGGEGPGVVRVSVQDSGPGIDEEFLPMIFEPFFTTKSGAAGTGLGLAVARSAVEEMGGSLRAENRYGEEGEEAGPPPILGARFVLVLPAAEGSEDAHE